MNLHILGFHCVKSEGQRAVARNRIVLFRGNNIPILPVGRNQNIKGFGEAVAAVGLACILTGRVEGDRIDLLDAAKIQCDPLFVVSRSVRSNGGSKAGVLTRRRKVFAVAVDEFIDFPIVVLKIRGVADLCAQCNIGKGGRLLEGGHCCIQIVCQLDHLVVGQGDVGHTTFRCLVGSVVFAVVGELILYLVKVVALRCRD